MKGYSEQRGVQSQMTFDAATGRFAPCVRVHDFELIAKRKSDHPPDANIFKIPVVTTCAKATKPSRSRRHVVMKKPDMQRVG